MSCRRAKLGTLYCMCGPCCRQSFFLLSLNAQLTFGAIIASGASGLQGQLDSHPGRHQDKARV